LDGKIADIEGNSKYLTSQKSLQLVHIIRARTNFILVGKNTVEKDNPILIQEIYQISYVRKLKKDEDAGRRRISKSSQNYSWLSFSSADSLNILRGNNVVFFVDEKYKNFKFKIL
jgi:diaminohydroxyphosphoribosylaminopyrimidine deaminase/5-amino-6-(5-phosphoribosylamino)uracil reductase